MKLGLFYELHEEAIKTEVDAFIEKHINDKRLNEEHENISSLLCFIHEVSHKGIKEIREYLGLPFLDFCQKYEFKTTDVEDWEEERTVPPNRLMMLLSYTLVQDFVS